MRTRKIYYENLDDLFFAISHPIRRDILFRLSGKDWSIEELAKYYQMSRPTIHAHLKYLGAADLLFKGKKSRAIIYSLDPSPLKKIMEVLTQYQSVWLERFIPRESAGPTIDQKSSRDS